MKRWLLLLTCLGLLSAPVFAEVTLNTDLDGDKKPERLVLRFDKPVMTDNGQQRQGRLLVYKGKTLFQRVPFEVPILLNDDGTPESTENISISRLPGKYFKPAVSVIKVDFALYACGMPGGAGYFTWDGKKLVHAFTTQRVSEAGVFYQEDEVILPPKSGKPDLVLVKTTNGEWDEKKEDYRVTNTETVKYQWNGTRLVLSSSESKPEGR